MVRAIVRWLDLGAKLAAAALVIFVVAGQGAQAQIVTTDVAGRQVRLDKPATRIVVGSSSNLDALALAHPDPVSLIVGWSGLASSMDATQADALRRRFPTIDAITPIGRLGLDTLSVETLMTLRPDLVVVNLYDLPASVEEAGDHPLVRKLENAGLTVLVVDFFVDPLAHSATSLRALGAAFGTSERVDTFLAFYEARLTAVADRLASDRDGARPRVFLHAHAAGADCCFSPGTGALDGFIRAAGGHNLGTDVLSTPTGQVPLEALIALQPDVYVATGGYARNSESGFTLGRDVDPREAERGFRRLLERPGLAALQSVHDGRAHGLWHDFTHSPLHLVAIETMARWFRPDLFADLDPEATLEEINERFLAVPLEGTFWIDAAR